MRIATWNLDHAKHPDMLQKFMERQKADIWILTETRPQATPGEGYTCAASSCQARDYPTNDRWVSIWVHERLRWEAQGMSADPERSAAVRILRGDQPALFVIGTVLPWRSDDRHNALRGAEAFCHELQRQACEWRALRCAHLADEFCIAGDFNQELVGSIGAGSRKGRDMLVGTLRDLGLRCVTATEPAAGKAAGIDHIVVSRGLLASELEFWPAMIGELKGLTDHYGVYAELQDAAAATA
jgi:hypothetical protein